MAVDITALCNCVEDTLEGDWFDCPKAGHEEGCFGQLCAECNGLIYLDCED